MSPSILDYRPALLALAAWLAAAPGLAGDLDDLARPYAGRSMRSTSTAVDENGDSSGYFLGVEPVRLRERRPRVKEWAQDKDKDWRKAPLLYR